VINDYVYFAGRHNSTVSFVKMVCKCMRQLDKCVTLCNKISNIRLLNHLHAGNPVEVEGHRREVTRDQLHCLAKVDCLTTSHHAAETEKEMWMLTCADC
jgi:hypothetical protein